jgi:hypothetical protein
MLLASPPRRRVFHHLRVNFAGRKRDKGREGGRATLARGLAVKFIPPRAVRSNDPEKFAGAAGSKRWTDRGKAVKQNAPSQNTITKIFAPARPLLIQFCSCLGWELWETLEAWLVYGCQDENP